MEITYMLSTIVHNLSLFAEECQDVVYLRRPGCRTIFYVNAAFVRFWGVAKNDIYADSARWDQCIHPADQQKYLADTKAFFASTQAQSQYFYFRLNTEHESSIRRMREVIWPIYNDNILVAYGGLVQDVTLDKLRLATFEQSLYFFQFFADKTRSVFWIRDETCQKQIYLSPGYEKVWGRCREALCQDPNSWVLSLHPEDREAFSRSARLRQLHEQGPDIEYEDRYRIFHADGSLRWIKDTSFPIYDERQVLIGFAGIAEDITKEVEYAEALQEAKQRAEVANKAKSDFLAMISHELRTPLNAILGMTQILRVKGLPTESEEYADIIMQAGRSLMSLVNDILDFARIEAGKLSFVSEPFDLRELIDHCIQSMQFHAAERHLALSSNNPVNECYYHGDFNRLRQVLINLLTNAIKFTSKGEVSLAVRKVQSDHSRALLEFTVKDTGIGMTPEEMQIIFDRFSQVGSIYNRTQGGIGLGLSITKELVTAMGGDIRVTSVPQQGSTFTVSLWLKIHKPSTCQEGQFSEYESSNAMMQKRYPFKVLLVEDNLINQKVATIMLSDFGCKVIVMPDGGTVLANLTKLHEYDVILMDVGLPDMSGYDIVKRLREEESLAAMPIVAITAHILDRDLEQARLAGMDKIIAKPISYESIATLLAELAAKRGCEVL